MIDTVRTKLKRFFSAGAKPTGAQFAELIDHCMIGEDDGIRIDEHGNAELTDNLTVRGDLRVDGTVWLANRSNNTAPNAASHSNGSAHSLPVGAIILWFGEDLPDGYALCDGLQGRPTMLYEYSVMNNVLIDKQNITMENPAKTTALTDVKYIIKIR
ncbi:hypothetical protein CWB96_06335 [Pseudoalteromonas citrea]|uniref:Uncharacterized protein n=1 Tax=Pseudoalteromonas citrea TaxID=43655 RepID=A0A5S3XRP9_9GAMM|nr:MULTISPECIES: hypothetical protein [Pseudoalteromonas]RJE76972.1 hypothetical protein BGP78_01620 [Pseudoalteromonas sp. MSK9-3]TMP41804.1 hypothetical protein CWB97_13645 [Pseudoalteromonas citrea]TMP60581.1 hypothetical protein CWB96_06335 [Pseudoalteromonas citrea]